MEILNQLNTVDPAVVLDFELDPCMSQVLEVYGPEDTTKGRGNCTAPDVCTCLCRQPTWYDADGIIVEEPWVDDLSRPLEPDQVYGRFSCLDGYEGAQNAAGRFTSCHLRIKVPTFVERYTTVLVAVIVSVVGVMVGVYVAVRWQLLRRAKEYRKKRRRQRDKDDDDVDLDKAARKSRGKKKAKKSKEKQSKSKKKSTKKSV